MLYKPSETSFPRRADYMKVTIDKKYLKLNFHGAPIIECDYRYKPSKTKFPQYLIFLGNTVGFTEIHFNCISTILDR